MAKEKEPLGVRLAEISKKVDLVQIAGGFILLPFFPALGAGIVVFSAGTWIAANEYQKRRRGKQQFTTA